MKNVLKILVWAAVVGFAASAFAGGGGTKATGYIEVTVYIDSDPATGLPDSVGVIVDPDLKKLEQANTPKKFVDLGGKIVTNGKTVKFAVKPGNHTVYAGTKLPPDEDTSDSITVNVKSRQVVKLVVYAYPDGTVTITTP